MSHDVIQYTGNQWLHIWFDKLGGGIGSGAAIAIAIGLPLTLSGGGSRPAARCRVGAEPLRRDVPKENHVPPGNRYCSLKEIRKLLTVLCSTKSLHPKQGSRDEQVGLGPGCSYPHSGPDRTVAADPYPTAAVRGKPDLTGIFNRFNVSRIL